MKRLCEIAAAATMILCLVTGNDLRAQSEGSRLFGDLLQRIPDPTNALLLINADGLFDSAMRVRDNWREKAKENAGGLLGIGPDASKVVVAVGVDFQTMDEQWRVGMAQYKTDLPSLEEVASREGGYVEMIDKTPVAWTPRGLELFHFPDKIVGFATPSDRKAIVKWVRSALEHPRKYLPEFARRAIFRADGGAQVALAIDLAESVSPKMAEPWLDRIAAVKKFKLDPTLLAPRLASVKSAFLAIKAGQSLEGTLRIDFERDIDFTAPVAREIITAVLDDYGADIPEFKSWTLGFDGKTAIEMSGRFSTESLKRVISLAHAPQLSTGNSNASRTAAPKPNEPKPAAEPKPSLSKPDPVGISQAYFRSVTSLMEDLKQTNRKTYRSNKLWYDRFAKQIEELPILNVDKDLLDWGSLVSKTLREMSSGINYYAKNQSYTLASNNSGSYGGYGYYGGGSRVNDYETIKKQSDAKMSVDLDARWQAMELSIADMRRKMVEKYKVDF